MIIKDDKDTTIAQFTLFGNATVTMKKEKTRIKIEYKQDGNIKVYFIKKSPNTGGLYMNNVDSG